MESITVTLRKTRNQTGTIFSGKDDYIIVPAKFNGKEVIVLGNMYCPNFECEYKLSGEWKNHRKYGKQFATCNTKLMR